MPWTACAIAACVALQLLVTLALPDQTWSMPMGLAGLCFICAAATQRIGARHGRPYSFDTIALSTLFAVWGLMWVAWIYEIVWLDGDQSLSSQLSFAHQILILLVLVPIGNRYGARQPVVLDIILGVVLCALVTKTLWPQILTGHTDRPPTYLTYLMYVTYAALSLASLTVQRRSPPLFLKAFVITKCLYAATSILSVELATRFMIPHNSPIWLYGDISMIVFPFIASRSPRPVIHRAEPDGSAAPNQMVPFLIAILVLCLAFDSAHRQQTLAGLIGIAGLLAYSFRFAYVTRQYRRVQDVLLATGRMRVEALMDVVHELRSPLASVVLNAGALARSDDVPDRLKIRVDTIANRCGTVTRLLNDVLDLERIEAGLMGIVVVPVDVLAVCRDALDAVATTAQAAGIALHPPDDTVPDRVAQGDAGLLVRVIVNLLDNAIRFTPAGGGVWVDVRPDGAARIAVIVEDNGTGPSAAAQATLFQRFGHAGDPVNGTKGSGLGLSISSSAIVAMHGRLTLAPRTNGAGTRATIVLERRGV